MARLSKELQRRIEHYLFAHSKWKMVAHDLRARRTAYSELGDSAMVREIDRQLIDLQHHLDRVEAVMDELGDEELQFVRERYIRRRSVVAITFDLKRSRSGLYELRERILEDFAIGLGLILPSGEEGVAFAPVQRRIVAEG